MAKKIEKLTPEQIATFPEYVGKWIRIGASTEPTDRTKAEAAIRLSYECADLPPPKEIIWFENPLSMVLGRAVSASVSASVWDSVRDSVRDSVWDSVWDSVSASVRASVWDSVRDSVRGQHESSWLSFYDYFANAIGLKNETAKLHGLVALAETCGWIMPYETVCFASEKHTVCNLDDTNVIHCENGPAIAYADGFEIHAWHGTVVPKKWIEGKLDAKEVLQTSDMEVRAAGMEIIGWPNMLDALNAQLIDKDDDPLIGELFEVSLPDLNGRHLIAKYECPRNGTMGQPVPPKNHLDGKPIITIMAAKAWMAEMTLEEYMPPEIRT